jgi:hypothetical protein
MARKKSSNTGNDEAIRKAYRDVQASNGTDLRAVVRLKAVLERSGVEGENAKSEADLDKEKIEEARRIMRTEYYHSVSSFVDVVLRELRSGDIQTQDDLETRILEYTGDCYWAIYTHASQQCLWASENSNYALEEGLVELGGGGDRYDRRQARITEIPWGSLAAWAYYRDIQEGLYAAGVDLNNPERFGREEEAEVDEVDEEEVPDEDTETTDEEDDED